MADIFDKVDIFDEIESSPPPVYNPSGVGAWKSPLSMQEQEAAERQYQLNRQLPAPNRPPEQGRSIDYPEGGIYPGITRGQELTRTATAGIPPTLSTLGGVVGTIYGTPGAGTITGEGLGWSAGRQLERLGNKYFGGAEPPPSEKNWIRNNPNKALALQTAGDVAEGALVGVGGAVMGKLQAGAAEALSPYAAAVKNEMLKSYERAILPKRGGLQADREKVADAMRAIVTRLKNIKLTDDLNLPSESTIPTNRTQHLDATMQAMGQVFKEYNDMQVKATGAGAKVDTKPLLEALEAIKKQPGQTFEKLGKEEIKIVDEAISDMADYGQELTPEAAQNILKRWNKVLSKHEKNPSELYVGRASVMATQARVMREELEKSIAQYSGPGYLQLRRDYGALKSILEDARKGAVKRANTAQGQFDIDMFDIYSTSLIVGSIAGGNPAGFAKAAAVESMKRIGYWQKHKDRLLANSYKDAVRLYGPEMGEGEFRDLIGMGAKKAYPNPDAIPAGSPQRLALPPPTNETSTVAPMARQLKPQVDLATREGAGVAPQFVRSHAPYMDTQNLINERTGVYRGNLGRQPPQTLQHLTPSHQTSVVGTAQEPTLVDTLVARKGGQGSAVERSALVEKYAPRPWTTPKPMTKGTPSLSVIKSVEEKVIDSMTPNTPKVLIRKRRDAILRSMGYDI